VGALILYVIALRSAHSLGHDLTPRIPSGSNGPVVSRVIRMTERAGSPQQSRGWTSDRLPTNANTRHGVMPPPPATSGRGPTCDKPLQTLAPLAFWPFCVMGEDCLCGTTRHTHSARIELVPTGTSCRRQVRLAIVCPLFCRTAERWLPGLKARLGLPSCRPPSAANVTPARMTEA